MEKEQTEGGREKAGSRVWQGPGLAREGAQASVLWLQSGPFGGLNPGSALGLQARTSAQCPDPLYLSTNPVLIRVLQGGGYL